MATGVAARCLRDVRCRQCTGKRLSRAIWSSVNKERMSHLRDSTVAGPTARRDNALASKCEYPPFRYPPFKCALYFLQDSGPDGHGRHLHRNSGECWGPSLELQKFGMTENRKIELTLPRKINVQFNVPQKGVCKRG